MNEEMAMQYQRGYIDGFKEGKAKFEPKTGYWVNGEYCSECGCDVPAYIIDWKWQKDADAKYCPCCGCRMNG